MSDHDTPTCVYRLDAELVEALDAHLGPPLDSYVRGWQVWLEPNGPGDETLEWRLHPPAGFTMPKGVNPHDLFAVLLQALADSDAASTQPLSVGEERRALADIWEVLEVYPAFPDPDRPGMTPDALVEAVAAALGGRLPDAAGFVDHARLGDLWKGKKGDFSVGAALLAHLEAGG